MAPLRARTIPRPSLDACQCRFFLRSLPSWPSPLSPLPVHTGICQGFSLASRSSFFTQSDKLPEKQIQPCNFHSKPFLIKNHEHISYPLVPGSYFLFTSYFQFKSYKVSLSYWPRAFFHPTYSFLATPSR